MLDLDNLQKYRENSRIEAKQALGGLPESLWETYSAFANAEGGVILLGVEELEDKSLHALDILDTDWMLEDFYAILRDPRRVSANILSDENVQVHEIDGKHIIAIFIPKAAPELRPVYIDGDVYHGSYVRIGEADIRLEREEIDNMLAAAKRKADSNSRFAPP